MPKPATKTEGDATGSWGVELGKAVKIGGLGLVVLLLIGGLVYFASRAVELGAGAKVVVDAPDRWTGSQARERWAAQDRTNRELLKAIEAAVKRLEEHEDDPHHHGSGEALAAVNARLQDVARRLDRIENKLDGR